MAVRQARLTILHRKNIQKMWENATFAMPATIRSKVVSQNIRLEMAKVEKKIIYDIF